MAYEHDDTWDWKHTLPYNNPHNTKDAVWQGACYCQAVVYDVTRDRPLSSKYCHCNACKTLHGAPFQWAAIFHKDDLRIVQGVDALMFYSAGNKLARHQLPCKVYCKHCYAPIMDEGRRMLMVFPTLIQGITTPKAREAFQPQCHIFYGERVVDFDHDGLTKWPGLDKT
ncbi:Mss4-like protein [Niveomyces insectorum RCEF 264]|uniref:Mss4-like protein n=1 Tax=Niveomyces insectorum RCEF 264 TaxID=1081102 RepID=A0A167SN85_9HYPO|nr:Mss4-like protein [Niveomyces insectorum RCEF 264]